MSVFSSRSMRRKPQDPPCDILKLERSYHTWEAGDHSYHLPRPEAVSRRSRRASFGNAIVLVQSAGRIRRRANVQRRMACNRAQNVDNVKCRYGLALNSHTGSALHGRPIV